MKQLSDYNLNPDNPRTISAKQLSALKKSLKSFPRMMELRPIVVDENGVILGGNQRLTGLLELGFKEVPDAWIVRADDLTADQKREFIIKDNVGFGEWDWDALQDWDAGELVEWGLELPEVATTQDATAPDDFKSYDENIATEHECPKCHYKWSGGK